ncbi:MAG: biotin-dependent carboxyltransferase family protein [Chitinophagia bacterium]|nr:biotin-dependent carboxyltransferase family protein [Chitinophagia bacterium]
MSLRIIKKGSCDSIRDIGRSGYQHLGIPPCGAMDTFSLQQANLLLGNDRGEACIEMFFPAPVIQFEADALIAISGANWEPQLNGLSVSINQPILVKKGVELRFAKPISGRVAYLSVQGGFAIDKWLGSYSTHIGVAFSGWKGKLLEKNDQVPFRKTMHNVWEKNAEWITKPWLAGSIKNPLAPIRIIAGKHFSLLDKSAQTQILQSSFSLLPESNRMGFLIKGIPLKGNYREMISSAVQFGTVQWLPDGQLIVLMADHPTTGGYPRIANVIQADLPRLAQWPLHLPVTFEIISREAAIQLYQEQLILLTQLQNATAFRLASYLEQR